MELESRARKLCRLATQACASSTSDGVQKTEHNIFNKDNNICNSNLKFTELMPTVPEEDFTLIEYEAGAADMQIKTPQKDYVYSPSKMITRESNKNKIFNNLVPDLDVTESEEELGDLFSDTSSDLYHPNIDEASDSDRDIFHGAEYKVKKKKTFGMIIFNSDEEPLENDDFVPPSQEDQSPGVNIPWLSNTNQEVRENSLPIADNTLPESNKKKRKNFSPKLKISRKPKVDAENWVKCKAALARERGEAYKSYKGVDVPAKFFPVGNLCPEKCRLKCSLNFTDDERRAIFISFYKLNTNSKNALLFSSILINDVQRKRKGATSHKTASFKYFVTCGRKQTRVCKNAFACLYQIGKKKIDLLQKSMKAGNSAPKPDKRGQHNNRPHKLPEDIKRYITQHISEFPAEESHYSRSQNINKKYLSPLLSISKMHQLYLEKCVADKVPESHKVKECTYRHVFVTEFNLSFGHPKSDTCSTCDAGKSNEEHVENYHAAFNLLKADRDMAKESSDVAFITMDLQQTMPLPRLTTSKAFYLRQMSFYNFGMHITAKNINKAIFCTWDESQASRGSSEVFSCVLTALELEESLKNKTHLIIWSDSCAGQNKNFLMICLYQYLIQNSKFKIIEHKFPEVGHTYLDSDRDFGRIEKNLRKHENIFTAEEYRHVIIKSGKSHQVIDMTQHFRDTEDLHKKLKLLNRKTDVLKNKVNFRDHIKWIRVEKYGSYMFKTCYDEYTPYREVNIFQSLKDNMPILEEQITSIPRLLTKTGQLKQKKVENLRDQLIFIPAQHQWWYLDILKDYPT